MGLLKRGGSTAAGSFLPQDYIRGKDEKRANVWALLLFGVVLVGTVGVCVLNLQRQRTVAAEVQRVRAEFEEESGKIEQLRALEAQRRELLESAEVVTALIDRIPRSVLMAEVARGLPEGVVVTKVELSGQRVKVAKPKKEEDSKNAKKSKSLSSKKTKVAKKDEAPPEPEKVMPPRFEHVLTLEGLAVLNNDVTDYLASLKQSPLFAGVDLQFIQETTVDMVDVRKFKMTAKLRGDANAALVAGAEPTDLLTGDQIDRIVAGEVLPGTESGGEEGGGMLDSMLRGLFGSAGGE